MSQLLDATSLTVVIPARNAAATISRTIASVTDQNGGTPVVLVVDDASTDNTANTARLAGATVISHEPPAEGPGAARNRGIKATRTPLVAFCDADDSWVPDRLQNDLDAFAADSNLHVLLGRSYYHADNISLLDGLHFERHDRTALIPHFGAATMRTSVFELVGLIDASLANYEDYEWFTRARDLGAQVVFHERVVQVRHIHADSTSRMKPPRPHDLLAVIQRSVVRRRDTSLAAPRASDQQGADSPYRQGGDDPR